MPNPLGFMLTGTVADIDDTVRGDPCHPALVVILDGAFGLIRVVTPPAAWPHPREVLQVGRRLRASCEPTLRLPPVATRIELLDRLH